MARKHGRGCSVPPAPAPGTADAAAGKHDAVESHVEPAWSGRGASARWCCGFVYACSEYLGSLAHATRHVQLACRTAVPSLSAAVGSGCARSFMTLPRARSRAAPSPAGGMLFGRGNSLPAAAGDAHAASSCVEPTGDQPSPPIAVTALISDTVADSGREATRSRQDNRMAQVATNIMAA
jgi:hypothetical protein